MGIDKCTCNSSFQSGLCEWCANEYKKVYSPKQNHDLMKGLRGYTMTIQKMKELYATGEWIAVGCDNVFMRYWEIPNCKFSHTDGLLEYKLIHIKHKEVLDHVLSGGEVSRPWSLWDTSKFDANIFFETYSKSNVYEIIPTKQDPECERCGDRFYTNEPHQCLSHEKQDLNGSLEHEEEGEDICGEGMCYCDNFECEEELVPPKRITTFTREEFKSMYANDSLRSGHIDILYDDIEEILKD